LIEKSEELIGNTQPGSDLIELERTVAVRALTHLAGSVGGKTVLDLACGEGSLARWLALHGANVTAVDSSVKAIEAARKHEIQDPHSVSFLIGDPEDLYMLDDSFYDEVLCNLSLTHIENLSAVVAEVARIIKLGGRFIFSVSHPCFDLRAHSKAIGPSATEDYFVEGVRSTAFGNIRHRTISAYINAVAARGFTVRRVLEPGADERDVASNPSFEIWRHMPVALIVEAVFPKI
jgi:2-polyprenyl-3-methyl-5-hydroxy-6-metoxy-1,4-benzoquinol methylase